MYSKPFTEWKRRKAQEKVSDMVSADAARCSGHAMPGRGGRRGGEGEGERRDAVEEQASRQKSTLIRPVLDSRPRLVLKIRGTASSMQCCKIFLVILDSKSY